MNCNLGELSIFFYLKTYIINKHMFSDLWQIAKKDLLEFSRDRLRLITFFIMPIFMMIMTGFIFPSQNSLKNITIGMTNQDTGSTGADLTNLISELKLSDNGEKTFTLENYDSLEAIKNGIKKQEISGGIFIPDNFSQNISSNEQAEITIVEDQANPQISQMVTQTLNMITNNFSQQLGIVKISTILNKENNNSDLVVPLAKDQKPLIKPLAIMQPITTKLEGIIPGNPNYFEFIAPGIVAMIVMTAVLTGLAASVSREKEQGTLDGILISPINRLAIILGKSLSQAIRGLVQGIIVLLLAFLLFGVTVQGNIFIVLLLLLLGIFSFVGLGILVSTIASKQETATQLLFMFQFPMLFLSGVFFPIALMPAFMQKIAYVIPLTYAIEALRKVMVLGAGFEAISKEILILLVFGVATLSISVPVFKRVITK